MNISNYKKVLKQIKEHPETWDQNEFHSPDKDKHSFLGWTQILSGSGLLFWPVSGNHLISFLEISWTDFDYLLNADRTLADFERFLEEKEKDEQ